MNVKDLDGNSSNWNLVGNIVNNKVENKSSLHVRAKSLLTSLFPTLQLLEEVPINVRRSETLYLDFYLPLKKYCIETHGEQHYKFVSFYHSTIFGFLKAKKRDTEKKEWCELNGIKYIELPFDETDDEWKDRIINA